MDGRSRTAPWAPPAAQRRLAAVEAALPEDALGAAVAAAAQHARRLEDECLLLYAGTNVPSPLVASLHAAALASQPSMGYPGDKYQAGLEPLDVVEVAAAAAVARVMGAAYAEVRPTSATLANLAVYTALARPGDTIAVLPASEAVTSAQREAVRAATSATTPWGRPACAGCAWPRCPTTATRSTWTSTRCRSSSPASGRCWWWWAPA